MEDLLHYLDKGGIAFGTVLLTKLFLNTFPKFPRKLAPLVAQIIAVGASAVLGAIQGGAGAEHVIEGLGLGFVATGLHSGSRNVLGHFVGDGTRPSPRPRRPQR